MDPNQTWRDLSDAVEKDHWGRAGELAQDLLRWISAGGFIPSITGNAAFDRIVVWQTCDAIVAWDIR